MVVELPGQDGDRGGQGGRSWTFLTNHARILIYITRNPRARVRDMADTIGITERAAQGIVKDLEEAGYTKRSRIGRRNRYSIVANRPFRHPADADHLIDELLALFMDHETPAPERPAAGVRAIFREEPPT